jgi:Predicted integral membrane protein
MICAVCLPAATALADAFKPSGATDSQTLMATALVFIIGVMFLGVCALLFLRVSHGTAKDDVRIWPAFLLVVALAVVLRVIAATVFTGYSTDIACFKGWAIAAYRDGPAAFYTSGMFSDYPPGYMAVLWVLGWIGSAFQIDANGALFTLIIKIPSILAEVGAAVIAYKIAERRMDRTFGLLCASFVLFNPAMFFNSSVWGQIDAILALFIVTALWFLINEQYIPAAALFALAVIFKPQAIMFTPVVGLAYVYALFKKGGLAKAVIGIFGGLAAAAAVLAVFILPFTGTQPLGWIIGKYSGAIGYYSYASINAFNVYTLLGLNWGEIPTFMLFGQQIAYGTVALALICVAVVILQWRTREQRRFFDIAAFLVISVFMLMHSMHERYMLAACACLIFAYIYSRDAATLGFAAAFSIYALLNQMLTLYADSQVAPQMPAFALSAVGAALYLAYAAVTVRKLWSRKVLIKTPAMLG